jgi:hypothetical protein
VLFEKALFHFFVQFAVCLFLIIIPQSTTQGSRPEKVKFFGFFEPILDFFFTDEIDNKPCSSERAETRVSDEMFPLFFGEFSLFFRFFCFVCVLLFFYKCLPSVSLGPWFESQALPDLWSPRVWFTFRNLKSFVLIFLEQDVANQNWPNRSKFWSKIAKIGATPPRRDRERLRREKNVLSKEILEVFC